MAAMGPRPRRRQSSAPGVGKEIEKVEGSAAPGLLGLQGAVTQSHIARVSGKTPRCPKSVVESFIRIPLTVATQASGSCSRPRHSRPLLRVKKASAFFQRLLSAGDQTAWAQGRSRTTRPKRSNFRPCPLSRSWYSFIMGWTQARSSAAIP